MDSKPIDKLIENAVALANQESHEYITVEHIMYCLLEDEYIKEICKDLKVDINNIKEDLDQYIKNEQLNGLVGVNGPKGNPKKTTGVERIIQRSIAQVVFAGQSTINPIDIFISILHEEQSFARYYCELNGLFKDDLLTHFEKKNRSEHSLQLVEEYTTEERR